MSYSHFFNIVLTFLEFAKLIAIKHSIAQVSKYPSALCTLVHKCLNCPSFLQVPKCLKCLSRTQMSKVSSSAKMLKCLKCVKEFNDK